MSRASRPVSLAARRGARPPLQQANNAYSHTTISALGDAPAGWRFAACKARYETALRRPVVSGYNARMGDHLEEERWIDWQ
jgi:hypothetical protein